MAALSGFLTGIARMVKRSVGYDAAAYAPARWRDGDPRWQTWNATGSLPKSVIDRSRHAYANDGYFRNGCDAIATALAGSGWGFAPKQAGLLDGWNRYVPNVVWGGGSFDALTVAIARDMVVSGEGLVVIQPDGTLHQLSRDVIDSAFSADPGNGRVIRDGVEFQDGREVAIHIRLDGATVPERIEKPRYMRVYRQDFPGQVRGVPWGASVLIAADTLGETEHALATGVKVAAMFAGIATDENQTGADFPFDGASSGNVLESGLEPGTLKVLPSGWRVTFATPQQAQQSAEFLRHQLHRLASGLGVPTHLLSNNLADANYSSLRAGMVEFSARTEAQQFGILVPLFLKPAWESFVTRQYLAGEIDDLDAAIACEFIPPARAWIDPQKDAAATAEMLKLGLTSRRRAVAELGWDVTRLDQEISEDRIREAALGLNFTETANA